MNILSYFIIPMWFFILSCNTKKVDSQYFEFFTLGEPEVRSSNDSFNMGVKFYLKADNSSIIVKINAISDDLTFATNDSIYYSKVKTLNFSALGDQKLDSFIHVIKKHYTKVPSGSIRETFPDSTALYCGGNYFFKFNVDNSEYYYNYKASSLSEPLRSFHYYIIEKYYNQKFDKNIIKTYINTDSIMKEMIRRKNIDYPPIILKIKAPIISVPQN